MNKVTAQAISYVAGDEPGLVYSFSKKIYYTAIFLTIFFLLVIGATIALANIYLQKIYYLLAPFAGAWFISFAIVVISRAEYTQTDFSEYTQFSPKIVALGRFLFWTVFSMQVTSVIAFGLYVSGDFIWNQKISSPHFFKISWIVTVCTVGSLSSLQLPLVIIYFSTPDIRIQRINNKIERRSKRYFNLLKTKSFSLVIIKFGFSIARQFLFFIGITKDAYGESIGATDNLVFVYFIAGIVAVVVLMFVNYFIYQQVKKYRNYKPE